MIKCEVIENFTLEKFGELKNVKRQRATGNLLEVGDTFEAEEELVKYLTGGNEKKKVVARVIEVLPKEKPIKVEQEDAKVIAEEVNKVAKKTTKKKTSKK